MALPDGPGREVEYLCMTHEHYRERVRFTYVDGPADVVFKILSDATRERDLAMRDEYARGGVPEYWMIDPEQKWAEVCRLADDGTYETVCDGSSGVLRSTVFPGLWFRTEWLLEEPSPTIDTVLREWGLLRGAAA